MELIEVDPIGAKTAETIFRGLLDVLGMRSTPLIIHRHAELRGDDDFIPAPAQRPANEFLAPGRSIDVGGVKEGDPGIESDLYHSGCGVVINPPAEIVAA